MAPALWFLVGLAVIPAGLGLYVAARLVPSGWRLALRLVRARMGKRLPYPDPEWRRPLIRLRYRVGLAFLHPYLARATAHWRWVHEKRGTDYALDQLFALRSLARLDLDAGWGDTDAFRRVSHPGGWPRRFHLLRWWR